MVEVEMKFPKSRLESLYKDFRKMEELNPDGFQANINTWTEFLTKRYFAQGPIVFNSGSMFLKDLSIPIYGSPKSIDVVLDKLIDDGYIIPLDDFLKGDADLIMGGSISSNKTGFWNYIQWFGSRLSFNKKSLTRADLPKSQDSSNDNKETYLKEISFVVVNQLQTKFDEIFKIMKKNILNEAITITSTVFSREEFLRKSGIDELIPNKYKDDINVLLTYMEIYYHIIVQSESIIKIVDKSLYENLLKNFSQDITENDVRIVNVKAGIYNMEKQIERLKLELKDIKTKETSEDFKTLPKRSRERYEQTRLLTTKYLTQLIDGISNLHHVKNQLDMCGSNQLLIETLTGSNEVIKSINDYIGSVDKVEELLDSIEEQNLKTEEINEALSNNVSMNTDKFNEEIEQELNGLVKTNQKVEKAVHKDESFDKMMNTLKDLTVTDKHNDSMITDKKNGDDAREKILDMAS